QIDALIYGAFEASFESEGQKVTPTFDLLPVVRLFDWLTATDQFLKTGNGQDLATLLQQAGEHTKLLGNRILEISEGLQLLRPMGVMKAAYALPEDARRASPDLSTVVPPFEMLLGRVVNRPVAL
ncbi:MAG: TM1812 family CRISPR-associated protein, partial [Cyanobacteria bacterium]|nr:TM1812 family CRISPR-associated protein [Cyanobacteriota bacterium]